MLRSAVRSGHGTTCLQWRLISAFPRDPGQLPIAVIGREASARLMVEIALGRRGSARQPSVITSANGHVLSMCARDPAVRDLFLSADLIHADGMSLVFASRLKCRTPLPERVATTDLFHDVARLAEASGASFYFLGGTHAVVEKAVHNVRQLYPKLAIAGFRHGYSRRNDDEAKVIAEVDAARPDILWVGMGRLSAGRRRAAVSHRRAHQDVGGMFDFGGKGSPCAAWMQAAGLEYGCTVGLEPRRLLLRYLVAIRTRLPALGALSGPCLAIREPSRTF